MSKRQSLYLKERRDEKAKIAESILDSSGPDKPLSDEQRKMFDDLLRDIKVLDGDIGRAEAAEDLRAGIDTDVSRRHAPNPRPEDRRPIIPANQILHKRLVAFRGEGAEERAYKSGMWALATLWNNEKAKQWCKDNGVLMIYNAALEGDNTKGGFLVPDELERTIIDLRETYGTFRQVARIRPMASDFQTIPRRAGGLTAYPIGEGVEITESTKLWSAVNLTARKWGVLSKYSSEVSEDAIINIGDDLASEVAYAFAYAEDNAGFNGDGTSTYHGITGVVTKFQAVIGAGQLAGAVDAATNHNTFAEIDNTDLATLMAKLPLYAQPRAGWFVSQPGYAMVFARLQMAAGGNTKVELAGRLFDGYLGYPIFKSQLLPTSTGDLSDKVMLMFGDASSAISMGTRRGVTLATSQDRYFESDMLAIRGTERFDINVHDIGDATTPGPLVALIGE